MNDFVEDVVAYINYQQGVVAERERIIKLLEDFDKTNASCQCCFTELCVNDAIALIKGENK